MEEHITNIHAVINTLNQIDVKGKENLNYLLGSISVLENILSSFTNGGSAKNEQPATEKEKS
jgi:hypothetical protein